MRKLDERSEGAPTWGPVVLASLVVVAAALAAVEHSIRWMESVLNDPYGDAEEVRTPQDPDLPWPWG